MSVKTTLSGLACIYIFYALLGLAGYEQAPHSLCSKAADLFFALLL